MDRFLYDNGLRHERAKSSLPGQTRGSVIMGEIKTIMLEALVSEILEYVHQ